MLSSGGNGAHSLAPQICQALLWTENFLTPNDVFYIRNHMPVPQTGFALENVEI